jgi:hypothetical protein
MLLPLFIAGVVTAGGEYEPPTTLKDTVVNLLIVKRPVKTPLEMLMEPDPVLFAFSVTFCDVEKPEAIIIVGPVPLVGAVSPNTNARS